MAVENYGQDFLLILLSFTALIMLIINPIYSWIASRKNFKKIITYCYSFLIVNLFLFIFYSRSLEESDVIQAFASSPNAGFLTFASASRPFVTIASRFACIFFISSSTGATE